VEDSTRVMLRLKALFRARAIPTRGTRIYQVRDRARKTPAVQNELDDAQQSDL
jgi:hypothetical protein